MRRLWAATTLAVCLAWLPSGTAQAAQESWYTYWGIGFALNSYSGDLEEIRDAAEDAGSDDAAIALEILGFYWPLPARPNTILGFVVSGTAESNNGDGDWDQINTYLMGMSLMHFFGPEPGAGFFIRGDLGLATYTVDRRGDDLESDYGYGALVGGGYGIPVSEGTRILFNVSYAYRHADGDDVGSVAFSVGGLF